MTYSSKIESSTAVADDVESTLSQFIPTGTFPFLFTVLFQRAYSSTISDYYKDEKSFLKRVEEDATAFQPFGQKIHSYTRPGGKGKNKQKEGAVDDDDADAIEYEVYYVSILLLSRILFPTAA